MSFNNINLSKLKVNHRVQSIGYSQISDFSNFPETIDNLKDMVFSSNSIAQIGPDLKRYYDLLILYLNNDPSFMTYLNEFKDLVAKISKYVLSSSDFIQLRDGLIELQNYLRQITETELYSETGIYTLLQKTARQFTTDLNNIIIDINLKYSNLEDGDIGRVIPDGTINESYLSDKLKEDFKYIELTNGIYVDKSLGDAIVIPPGLVKKPIVIKVRNVS